MDIEYIEAMQQNEEFIRDMTEYQHDFPVEPTELFDINENPPY